MKDLEKLQKRLRSEWWMKKAMKYLMWVSIVSFIFPIPIQYPLAVCVASFFLLWKCKFSIGSLCLKIEAIKDEYINTPC